MTYARARRRALRDLTLRHIRCVNCWHLNLPEWAPFCSSFCHDAWAAKMIPDD
jgi:hypothetical protein